MVIIMSYKKIGVYLTVIGFCLIFIGSFAYYYKEFNGTIIGNSGAFVFDVYHNGNSFQNIDLYDTLTVKSVADERVIVPGDKGEFTLDVKATGSSTNVLYDIVFMGSNIPTNMVFYIDNKKVDMSSYTYNGFISAGDNMDVTHTIKWEWPYAGDANDDIDFINKKITISVNIIGKQTNDR